MFILIVIALFIAAIVAPFVAPNTKVSKHEKDWEVWSKALNALISTDHPIQNRSDHWDEYDYYHPDDLILWWIKFIFKYIDKRCNDYKQRNSVEGEYDEKHALI